MNVRDDEVGTNPVIKTTPLYAFPGWQVREYTNGMFDASRVDSPAISVGLDSFAEAAEWAKAETRGEDPFTAIRALR